MWAALVLTWLQAVPTTVAFDRASSCAPREVIARELRGSPLRLVADGATLTVQLTREAAGHRLIVKTAVGVVVLERSLPTTSCSEAGVAAALILDRSVRDLLVWLPDGGSARDSTPRDATPAGPPSPGTSPRTTSPDTTSSGAGAQRSSVLPPSTRPSGAAPSGTAPRDPTSSDTTSSGTTSSGTTPGDSTVTGPPSTGITSASDTTAPGRAASRATSSRSGAPPDTPPREPASPSAGPPARMKSNPTPRDDGQAASTAPDGTPPGSPRPIESPVDANSSRGEDVPRERERKAPLRLRFELGVGGGFAVPTAATLSGLFSADASLHFGPWRVGLLAAFSLGGSTPVTDEAGRARGTLSSRTLYLLPSAMRCSDSPVQFCGGLRAGARLDLGSAAGPSLFQTRAALAAAPTTGAGGRIAVTLGPVLLALDVTLLVNLLTPRLQLEGLPTGIDTPRIELLLNLSGGVRLNSR